MTCPPLSWIGLPLRNNHVRFQKKPRLITLPQTRVSPSNPFPQPIAHGTKGKPLSDEESMKAGKSCQLVLIGKIPVASFLLLTPVAASLNLFLRLGPGRGSERAARLNPSVVLNARSHGSNQLGAHFGQF